MIFWVMLAVLLNGVISFAYSVRAAGDTTLPWAILAVNFVFFTGITQTGAAFSAIMRLTKSEWGKSYSRLAEILTLSFMPVAAIVFIILYVFGTGRLFYWANPVGAHGNPWVGRGLFFWRNVITNALFYITSYLYFSSGRREEADAQHFIESREKAQAWYGLKKRLNILAGAVCFFYVIANTAIAWDFGMMIIPEWENSIFPPYFWSGNLLSGAAFVFLIAFFFMPRGHGKGMDKGALDSMGTVFMGFVLLWVYMFWSQHIVLWYANVPHLMEPVFKQMSGNFAPIFIFMLLTIFVIPFIALLFKRLKRSTNAMAIIAGLICAGIWVNRYLMIIPIFSDGGEWIIARWTNISLIFGGLASTILSLIVFFRLFSKRFRLPGIGQR
ncbi:MAG: polysulfide reductase NrfD [Deltaproteobacteria bacterium]|nr:polysulfide reductase NrfD [Deltaproteobacteria bacterium]